MNTVLLIANGLVLLTFLAHTFWGDGEYRKIEPPINERKKLAFWTMGRGAFHIVSIDFLLATVGLALINFTDYFKDPKLILQLLALYFFGYGLAFFLTLVISKKLPNGFFKLSQWILLLVISGFIYFGIDH